MSEIKQWLIDVPYMSIEGPIDQTFRWYFVGSPNQIIWHYRNFAGIYKSVPITFAQAVEKQIDPDELYFLKRFPKCNAQAANYFRVATPMIFESAPIADAKLIGLKMNGKPIDATKILKSDGKNIYPELTKGYLPRHTYQLQSQDEEEVHTVVHNLLDYHLNMDNYLQKMSSSAPDFINLGRLPKLVKDVVWVYGWIPPGTIKNI